MERIVFLALLPIVALTLVLGWLWLMHMHKSDAKISLRGLGITINVSTVSHNDRRLFKESDFDNDFQN